MSDKVNEDVIAELDTASKVTTKCCHMSITTMMQFTRIAKWAVRSKKENCDILSCIRAKLEEMFGGTWMVQPPQILKVHPLPKLDHRLALSAVNKGLLRRLDRLVRREVIRWLHLPRQGVPLEFFHSLVMYGGLGIQSYSETMVDINNLRLDLLI